MSRLPMNLTLDMITQREIDNGEIASYQLLAEIDEKQHSLATKYMGPPVWYSFDGISTTGATATAYIHYLVPPQVTKVGLLILASGEGTITATTETEGGVAIDSTGSQGEVDTSPFSTDPLVAVPVPMMDAVTGATAEDGRKLTVASSPSWDWQACVIKIVLTAVAASSGPPVIAATTIGAHGVQVIPEHVIS